MTVKFKKWGNSMGLLIPKILVEKYGIDLEKEYDLIEHTDGFALKEKSPKPTLDELLEGMSHTNRHEEQITGEVGKERFWEDDKPTDHE